MTGTAKHLVRSAGPSIAIALIVVVANVLAFSPGLGGAFFFDDLPAIVTNESLRHLGQPSRVLWPEKDLPVAGRPLANLSLAINYHFHQLRPWGYQIGRAHV